jgi:enterochelin esterase-like enzyme
MRAVRTRSHTSRAQVWFDGLGDWKWPGSLEVSELVPPAWVPAIPEGPAAGPARPGAAVHPRSRRFLVRRLVALLAAAAVGGTLGTLAIHPQSPLPGRRAVPTPVEAAFAVPEPLPALQRVSAAASGSVIDSVHFRSGSIPHEGAFLVYLPPGYGTAAASYPVLYLLHGQDGHASAFVEIGIQSTLDHLIARGAIPPMIAVMVQDAPGMNNWRDFPERRSATYVVEVQELVDRMLRTIPVRAGRAIAGSSMGGFGAMNVALANPLRFAVVESWLGFFNGLEGAVRADRPVIKRLGLSAFLYGAAEDPVAVPSEDPEFAALLQEAGARAQGVIYPGGHSLGKVQEHLAEGVVFAARGLAAAQARAAAESAREAALRPVRRRPAARRAAPRAWLSRVR